MFSRVFTALAAAAAASAGLVAAQNASQSEINTGIATVLANLEGTRVIPNLLPESSFELKALLDETFDGTTVQPGQMLSVAAVADKPTWSLSFSSQAAESDIFEGKRFTVMTLDPGAASDQPRNVVRHYLANNLTLTSNSAELRNSTEPIAGWFSPAPPAGDGVHRYTTLVFVQGDDFELPDEYSQRNETIDLNFDVQSYIDEAGLGPVVAATFFLCQNDDASAATTASGVVSTTEVPAATVSAVASSVSVRIRVKENSRSRRRRIPLDSYMLANALFA